jgi:DNA-binding response OmpR family regulator
MSRILVVEDEPRIASFIEKGLRADGHSTVVLGDGHDAEAFARDEDFDLLVLDLGLPGQNGHAVLHAIRRRGERMPVIILSARQGLADTVAGLDGGADDYVTKPFRFEELLARVRARLREPGQRQPDSLTVGRLSLDLRTRRVTVGGQALDLSTREFALLQIFLRHPGQVLTREQLLSNVWGFDFDPASNIVDAYVKMLRRKVGSDAIETVRGTGYRLVG